MDAADYIMLSALQHYQFCPRQCALIHVSQEWAENVLTTQGAVLHERADQPGLESRGNVRFVRAMQLSSKSLGVAGKADVVQFDQSDTGVAIKDWPGLWQPMPVEYKRGKPKRNDCDHVQLCAQAICLEETLNCDIAEAALYYGQTRRRHRVQLTAKLRSVVADTCKKIHELIRAGSVPRAERQAKCKQCSLLDICLPSRRKASAAIWLDAQLTAHLETE